MGVMTEFCIIAILAFYRYVCLVFLPSSLFCSPLQSMLYYHVLLRCGILNVRVLYFDMYTHIMQLSTFQMEWREEMNMIIITIISSSLTHFTAISYKRVLIRAYLTVSVIY